MAKTSERDKSCGEGDEAGVKGLVLVHGLCGAVPFFSLPVGETLTMAAIESESLGY